MQKTAKESDNIYDCLVFDFKQINSNLTIQSGKLGLNTKYIIRDSLYNKIGRIAQICLAINDGNKIFPKERINIGTLPEFLWPTNRYWTPISCSIYVNWFLDKCATAGIRDDGSIVVDNGANDDIQEFVICATYYTRI